MWDVTNTPLYIMKKSFLSILILGSFGLYVLWQGGDNSATASYVADQSSSIVPSKRVPVSVAVTSAYGENSSSTDDGSSKTRVTSSTSVSTSKPKPVAVTTPKNKGMYNDGTYTGIVADAYYGKVQVQADISNGRLADVQFLDYPSDRSYSRQVNSVAMPALTQEAISAQSANVDGVSGASDTSAAFRQSLASALSKARA